MKRKLFKSLLLVITAGTMMLGCKKKEDVATGGKVNFSIDGKNYEGTMHVTANPTCQTSKAIVIADATGSYIITLFNYKSTSDTVYDPLLNNNQESCTKITVGVVDGSPVVGYFSTSGSWQVSGSKFTLNCNVAVPSSNTNHVIKASGTLQ